MGGTAGRRTASLGGRLTAAGLVLVVSSLAGLEVLGGTPGASAADGSELTVAWASINSADLAAYQPPRDPGSAHYGDFEDVQVTVSQTRNLVDQAVKVKVTGMPGATQRVSFVGTIVELGMNFVQAFQCWGDPADPEFYKNCMYGAWTNTNINADAAPKLVLGAASRGTNTRHNVPFRDVFGREYSSLMVGSSGQDTEIYQVMAPETTNERHEMVDADGVAEFLFEVQSAASQPYMGCGDESSATGTRCWLVVVPRGSHTSPVTDLCLARGADQAPGLQTNSPVNPECEYWSNRVVVPLDFQPTGSACEAGGAERLVVAGEPAEAAFSSWQAGLCRDAGAAYALAVSADTTARGQVISGQAHMAITSRPLTLENLPDGVDTEQVEAAEVVYAPVAVSAIAIGFLANSQSVRQTDVKLTPRLVAKLVTHSYGREQGLRGFSSNLPAGPWSVNPLGLVGDPEFTALNPGVFSTPAGGTLIMTGPNSADGIAQLWAYLQADDKARAFLAGDPDNILPGDEANTGMTINTYYLPKGHPDARVPVLDEVAQPAGSYPDPTILVPRRDTAGEIVWREVGLAYADGTPMCLCDAPVDTFLKADETPQPISLGSASAMYRFDMLQSLPYASNLGAAARMVFRGDKGSKTAWDTTKWKSDGTSGDYASSGMSMQSNVYLNGFTDAATASRYGLPTASLQAPNQPGVYADAAEGAMGWALRAQQETAVDGVTVTDPAALPAEAYPLTSVLWAAVDLAGADEEAREQYADLIEYAVTVGQEPGLGIGQLPEGYLPLSDALRDQALAAVQTIRDYQDPTDDPTPTPTPAPTAAETAIPTSPAAAPASFAADNPAGGGTSPGGDAGADPPADPGAVEPGTVYGTTAESAALATAAAAPPARATLGGVLAVGAAGLVAGPMLMRRKKPPDQ